MRYFDNELTIRNNDAISTILNHIALTMFAADDEELTAEEFFERWIKNKPTIDEDCVRFAFLMDDESKNCQGIYYLSGPDKMEYMNFSVNPDDVYINSITKRVYDTLDMCERWDTDIEDLKEEIQKDPLPTMNYLLDLIDTLNDMMG